MEVSIVIPAYNEGSRIGPTLKRAIEYSDRHFSDYEIIVVDDGSKDNTIDIVAKHKNPHLRLLKNGINRGKGYSVRRGVLQARLPYVLFSDSDLATPIEEIEKLAWFLDREYDIAFGSRNVKGSEIRVKQPWYRILVGRGFALLVNLFAVHGFRDTQCGFKIFKKRAAREIFRRSRLDRFSFDVEVLFIAKKRGYKIKEVPIIWIDKKGSKVDPVKDSLRMLRDILVIRLNSLFGLYR